MSGIVRNKIGGVAGAHSRVVHVLGKSSSHAMTFKDLSELYNEAAKLRIWEADSATSP